MEETTKSTTSGREFNKRNQTVDVLLNKKNRTSGSRTDAPAVFQSEGPV